MPFQFNRLAIADVIQIDFQPFPDDRGLFAEVYKRSAFAEHGIGQAFVQDNYSISAKGVLRGLHFQRPPKAQAKLVTVFRGEIFDVAVDVRCGSPTYGKWLGMVLSASKQQMLYVPEGFAHGFCVLSDEACVMYKVTEEYAPEAESGVVWNDPTVKIEWPIRAPVVSDRDACLPRLGETEPSFFYADMS